MKIRFFIQVFWVISYFGTLLSGIFFSEDITRYLFPMLTIGVLVPFLATHYLSLTNQAHPNDFSYLNAMFLIYALFAVFYADDAQSFFTKCIAIFIAIGLEFYWPNWLFSLKSKILLLLKRK